MNTDKQRHDIADELLAIFARKDADGSYHYTNEQAFDGLVAVLLDSGMDLTKLPPVLEQVLIVFMQHLKVPAGASSDVVGRAITDHFKSHPLDTELRQEIRRFSHAVAQRLGEAADDGAKNKFSAGRGKKGLPGDGKRNPSAMLELRGAKKKKD